MEASRQDPGKTKPEIVSDCHGAEKEDNWFPGDKYETADDIRHV